MKHITFDRVLIVALIAAMAFNWHSQRFVDECQDRAMEEFMQNSAATLEAMEYEVEWLNNVLHHRDDLTEDSLPPKTK